MKIKYLIKEIDIFKKTFYFKTDVGKNTTCPTMSLCLDHWHLCTHTYNFPLMERQIALDF